MIEFEVVDDGDLRQVMHELAPLVEEGRIVFVAFDNEPFALRKAGALLQVVWNPANQIAGIEAIMFEYPRQQRRCRRLPVCPSNHQRTLALYKKALQQFG